MSNGDDLVSWLCEKGYAYLLVESQEDGERRVTHMDYFYPGGYSSVSGMRFDPRDTIIHPIIDDFVMATLRAGESRVRVHGCSSGHIYIDTDTREIARFRIDSLNEIFCGKNNAKS